MISAIIVAAGKGTRMGPTVDKLFLELNGRPVAAHTWASQQLLPAANGAGRYPAVEILIATNATRNLIRRGEDHQLRASIETGRAEGMLTMEQSLAELVRAGRISRETALGHCNHPEDLRRHMNS